MRRVCIYCGSSAGASPVYAEAADRLGRLLARRGIGLVYGGGKVGLMGVLADAALDAGGEVIGVIPDFLEAREVGHGGLTAKHVVKTMHQRKARMAELSDAFVALPGGLGTLEELFEVWTWTQLGAQSKPVGLLDVQGFYAPLVALVDHLEREGFVSAEHRHILQVASEPDALLQALEAWRAPASPERWVTPQTS